MVLPPTMSGSIFSSSSYLHRYQLIPVSTVKLVVGRAFEGAKQHQPRLRVLAARLARWWRVHCLSCRCGRASCAAHRSRTYLPHMNPLAVGASILWPAGQVQGAR